MDIDLILLNLTLVLFLKAAVYLHNFLSKLVRKLENPMIISNRKNPKWKF